MIDETSLLCIANESLLSSVKSSEDLLEANNVEVIELLDKFIEPCILEVSRVCLHRRRSHEHVVSKQSNKATRDHIRIK